MHFCQNAKLKCKSKMAQVKPSLLWHRRGLRVFTRVDLPYSVINRNASFSSEISGSHEPAITCLINYYCYNRLQKYLRHCKVFWHKWPVHYLVLFISPPPLIKVASNSRPCSKLGGTTLNGREEGGQHCISQTCDQERFEARKVVFSWECLNIFATGCSVEMSPER